MLKRAFFLLSCVSFLTISCSKTTSPDNGGTNDIIKQSEVENIVSTLSDNSMMGRASFSPGTDKAADFIVSKFEEIGLETLDGQSGYRQEFSIYRLTPTSSSLQINGETIQADSFFVDSNYEELNWTNLNSFNTITISADEPLGNALSAEENTVVLVDPAHKDDFEQYARGYGGGGLENNKNEGHSILYVRTSITSVNSGNFTYTASSEELVGHNLAGKISGTSASNEKVLYGAHYDHVGYLEPVDGDSIANGADDNASGTASLIMLAKYFQEGDPPPRTLIFAAFTAEEIGLIGSYHFSKQINPDQTVAMINMDMLGKPSKFGPNTAYLTGFEKSNLGNILKANLEDTKYDILADPYPEQNLFFRSDNVHFANMGIPAHTVSTVKIDTDQYYHTVDDEINTLDLENLTNLIRAIAQGSKSIVDGTDTPDRIGSKELSEKK